MSKGQWAYQYLPRYAVHYWTCAQVHFCVHLQSLWNFECFPKDLLCYMFSSHRLFLPWWWCWSSRSWWWWWWELVFWVQFPDYLSSSQISVIDKSRVSCPLYLYEAFTSQQYSPLVLAVWQSKYITGKIARRRKQDSFHLWCFQVLRYKFWWLSGKLKFIALIVFSLPIPLL